MMTLVASDGLWPNADILRRLETEIATFLLVPIILDHLLESNIFFGFELKITKQIKNCFFSLSNLHRLKYFHFSDVIFIIIMVWI